MLPPGLETPKQVKRYYDGIYETHIATGGFQPFLYPWATIAFAVIIGYLLIDHRKSPALRSLRKPLFGCLSASAAWFIFNTKARSPAAAYGVGLIMAFGTLWTGCLMFFNDCQEDFKRIERADGKAVDQVAKAMNGSLTRADETSPDGKPSELRRQSLYAAEQIATQGPSQRTGPLIWQSYPTGPFIERLDWVIDAFINFRGVGWNFQTYGIPPPPAWVEAELEGTEGTKPEPTETMTLSKTGIRRFTDRTALLKLVIPKVIIGFFILDLIKLTMHHDPYFWGYTDAPPPTWLPPRIRASPILTKSYRLTLSLFGIKQGLNEIFLLGPISFAALLGPTTLGLRGEPWLNPPDFFGAFTGVLTKGLAGWWGTWWHQVFRHAFGAPATALLTHLHIPKHSPKGKTIALVTAFFLSGCLHACGSYTQLGDTRPLLGPFRFFMLQPLGILAQTAISQRLKRAGVLDRIPRPVRQLANFIVVHVWMYHTAPLLVDDFARGGVWLYEPLAISPLRLLGLGAKDDNGWDLWYGLVFWRRGKGWLDTGLAF